jgi:spore protease
MWEGATDLLNKINADSTEKKYFNKLAINKSMDDNGFNYITITINDEIFNNKELQSKITAEIAKSLKIYMKKYSINSSSSVLVVGLGNNNITADSLGSRVCDKVIATKHLYENKKISSHWGNLSCLKPSVSGVTGLSSYDIIKSIIDCEKPNIVIVVDTLSCRNYKTLASTIQFSDDGIEPGAGVGNPKPKLNYSSLNIPVIAIGVPLVIYISKLISNIDKNNSIIIPKDLLDFVVTAKEIDFQIADFATIIAEGINQTVHFSKNNNNY